MTALIRRRGLDIGLACVLTGLGLVLGLALSARPVTPPVCAEITESAAGHSCRLWGCVSESIPPSVIQDHLVNFPNSIRSLSVANRNGWSVAYYDPVGPSLPAERSPQGMRVPVRFDAMAPTVRRGQPPAYLDPLFDAAVAEAGGGSSGVALSHVRICSSGLCDIPDPHPFQREKRGHIWLMEHNGTIDKAALLDLIRPDFLAANPPQYGDGESEWIDSELYFIYMLQTLGDFGWRIKPALGALVQNLRERIPGTDEQLNFLLTDGATLWGYRQGPTLYYLHDSAGMEYSAIASQYPSSSQEPWVEMANGQIVTLVPNGPPLVEEIEAYFDRTPASEVPLEASPTR